MDKTAGVISVATLTDQIQCAICLDDMKQATISSKCGHRFCKKCIEEWVDREHNCSTCRADLKPEHLVPDHQFDSLLETIQAESKVASTDYLNSLLGSNPSPIEKIFRRYFRESLAVHERYFQDLRRRRDKAKSLVHESESDKDRIAEAESFLDKQYDRAVQLLQTKYEDFFAEHLPTPSLSPVSVILRVPTLHSVHPVILHPGDTGLDVKHIMLEVLRQQKHQILSLSPQSYFQLIPVFKTNHSIFADNNKSKHENDNNANGSDDGDEVVLHDDTIIQLEHQVDPGSELVFVGELLFDQAKEALQCAYLSFEEDPSKEISYFKCNTCKVTWVCEVCREHCHDQHEIVAFTSKVPERKLCYCYRKRHVDCHFNK
eukprot:m.54978 g.54978  ORF g.54978 m.54978 type:complete len:374 (-) comp18573_c0_seq2:10-1131(-)